MRTKNNAKKLRPMLMTRVRSPGMPAAEVSRPRNQNLQWLRAIAALFVVLYHAGVYLDRFRGDDTFLRLFDGRFGLIGVAVFFAISGALMAEILPRVDPWSFLLHRIARIYPLFLIVLFSLLVAGGRLGQFDPWAATLVPVGDGRIYYLGVEWTLLFETTFYIFLFVCSLAGLRNRLNWIAALWLAAISLGTLLLPHQQIVLTPTIDMLPVLAVNAAFAGGMLIPSLCRLGVFQPALATLGVGFMLLCGAFSFGGDRWAASCAAIIFVGLVWNRTVDRPTSAQGWFAKVADRYGDWSYALYLCHAPLIIVLTRKPIPAPSWVIWCLAIAIPLLVAVPYGLLDLALYRRIKRWIDHGSTRTRAMLASLYVASFVAVASVAAIWGTGVSTHTDPQPVAIPVAPPSDGSAPILVPNPEATP